MYQLVISTRGTRINYAKKKVATRTVTRTTPEHFHGTFEAGKQAILAAFEAKRKIHKARLNKLTPAEIGELVGRWENAAHRAIQKLKYGGKASYRGTRYTIVQVAE